MYKKSQRKFARVASVALATVLIFQNAAGLFFDRNSGGSGSVSIKTGGVVKSDGNTGAVVYDFPINLPAGRRGMQPNLNLTYNSQLKNNQNWIGYGWEMSIPKIERLNKNGVAKMYIDNNFKSNIYGELEFDSLKKIYTAKKNDTTRAEFKKVKNQIAIEYFEVIDNTGKKYIYTDLLGKDFVWYLTDVYDEFENNIHYEYLSDASLTENNFIYPSRITYTNNSNAEISGIYEVRFNYQDRLDIMTSYASGYFTKNDKIVKSIEIYTDKVKRYEYGFRYDSGANGRRSLLAGITETAILETGEKKSLPETAFQYSKFEAEYKYVEIDKNNFDRIVDINNDGWTDFVFSRQHILDKYEGGASYEKFILRNKKDFKFEKVVDDSLPYVLSQIDDRTRQQESRPIYFADINNDGEVDILDKKDNGYLRINNMDGDARPDISYEANGNNNQTENIKLSAYNYIDLSGDGLDDKVYAHEGYIYSGEPLKVERNVWMNNGKELVETAKDKYTLPSAYLYHLFNGYTVYNNLFVDLNADGLMDILGQNGKSYINDGENLKEVAANDPVLNLFTGGFAADLNADSLSEIVIDKKIGLWSGETVNTWSPKQPADLLFAVKSPLGSQTTFQYKASSFYANNNISTIVWTLYKEKTEDIEKTYNYEGAKIYKDEETLKNFDSVFAGFEKVETVLANGLKTTNYFYQDDKLKLGKVKKQEVYDISNGQNTLLRENIYEYVGKENLPKSIVSSEFDKSTGKKVSQKQEYFYDNFGNLLNEVVTGSEPGDKTKVTENTYKQSIIFPKKYLLAKTIVGGVSKTEYVYNEKDLLAEIWKYRNATEKEVEKKNWDKNLGVILNDIAVSGANTSYKYDLNKMFVIETINTLGQKIRSELDNFFQKVTLATGVDGLQVKTTFDPFGRVTKVYKKGAGENVWNLLEENFYIDTQTENSVTNKKYFNKFGGLENSVTTVIYKDNLGRVIKESKQNWSGGYTDKDYIYDNVGNLIKERVGGNLFTNYKYDVLGRGAEVENQLGVEKNIYSPRNKTTIDKGGNEKRYTYDHLGNLVEVKEEYVTRYEYDVLGNLLKIVDAENKIRNIAYDWLGRKISDGVTTFSYKPELKYAVKNNIRINFDDLGRKVSDSLGNTYIYDTCQNGVGRLCVASSSDGVVRKNSYNSNGQIEKQETTLRDNKNTVIYKYDLSGQVIERGDGLATSSYKYKQNFLEKINLNFIGSSTDIFSSPVYNDFDQLISHNRGDLKTTNIYDAKKINRLTGIKSEMATNTLQNSSFEYDNLSRINKISNNINNKNQVKNYVYDNLGRLTRAESILQIGTTTNSVTENFNYDRVGNVLDNFGKTIFEDSKNTWDTKLRLGSNGQYNFLWDDLDRLKEVKVSTSSSWKYFYDTEGQRVFSVNATNKLFTPNSFYQDTGTSSNWLFTLADKPIVNLEKKTELSPVDTISTSSKKYSYVGKLEIKNMMAKIGFDKAHMRQVLDFKDLEIGKPQKVTIYFKQRFNNKDFEIKVATGTLATSSDKIFNFKGSEMNAFSKYTKSTSTTISFIPLTSGVSIVLGDRYGQNNYFVPVHFKVDLKLATTTYTTNRKYESKTSVTLQSLITDHLNSVEKVLDFKSGKVLEENEFSAFGKVAGATTTSSNIKYTGHQDDQENTGLIYMKARYMNPGLKTFISSDEAVQNLAAGSPLLLNPQSLNTHSYAWNNPVNAHDPDGKLTVVIPGTWHKDDTWNTNNRLYLNAQAQFDETPVLFNDRSQWSGGNNHNDRMLAGNNLADFINNYEFAEGEQLNIVGFSHGGNVAKIATHMLTGDRQVDNLVTLGTPVRSDYPTNMSRIQNMIEIYSNNDFVQTSGGNRYQLRAATGYVANRGRSVFDLDSIVYERGPAARYENANNAVNVTNFTTPTLTGLRAHSELHYVNSVWDFVFNK